MAGLWGLLSQAPQPARAVLPRVNGKIVFTSDRTGNFEIFVMNANGSGVTQLTHDPAEDREPVWSPDGSKIVFVSTRDGNYDIFVMNADGTGQTNLTRHPTFDDEPATSTPLGHPTERGSPSSTRTRTSASVRATARSMS